MKRILILEGSPRPKGNTALATDWVVEGLGRRGLEVERIPVAGLDIGGCRECTECTSTKKGAGCAQDDDMTGLYDRILGCDLLVLASPIFCWGVTGQLKTVTDRFFALLTGDNLLKDKPLALVITAGGDEFDGADLAVAMYRNFARYSGMSYLGQFVVAPSGDRRSMRRDEAMRSKARRFGRELRRNLL